MLFFGWIRFKFIGVKKVCDPESRLFLLSGMCRFQQNSKISW